MNLNKTKLLAALSGLALLASSGCALAQSETPPQPIPPHMGQEMKHLDQLSNENNALVHRNWGPPPPQSSIPPIKVTPAHGFWGCLSVDDYKHVHSAPSAASPVVAITYDWVAAGPTTGQFTKVHLARGKIGYVRTSYLHPFHDKYAPKAICTFEGDQPSGLNLFNIRTPKS